MATGGSCADRGRLSVSRQLACWSSVSVSASCRPPRVLQRGDAPDGFDALVQGVSTDVGPRAVLDEMLRLGVVRVEDERIELDTMGMVPRGDHAAAACANLEEGRNLLEQAVYVDEISPDSAQLLHQAATRAWQPVVTRVLRLADKRVAHDAAKEDEARRQVRVRFGVYFYAEDANHKKESE